MCGMEFLLERTCATCPREKEGNLFCSSSCSKTSPRRSTSLTPYTPTCPQILSKYLQHTKAQRDRRNIIDSQSFATPTSHSVNYKCKFELVFQRIITAPNAMPEFGPYLRFLSVTAIPIPIPIPSFPPILTIVQSTTPISRTFPSHLFGFLKMVPRLSKTNAFIFWLLTGKLHWNGLCLCQTGVRFDMVGSVGTLLGHKQFPNATLPVEQLFKINQTKKYYSLNIMRKSYYLV